jgi:gamma-glutamyltranspeptidase/glutathione hydrolase
MVSTSQPLAALTGAEVLRDGGNAMDAALAAAGVLAVTEPNQCGVGGDLFAIVVRDGESPVGLNASGRSPADPGDALPELFGPRSVTVPGCPSGWADLAERFSSLGLAAALQPAIALARRGFPMQPRNTAEWTQDWGELSGEAREVFQPRVLRQSGMADTLETIVAGGFYQGDTAAVAAASWLAPGDLGAHRNDWVEPLAFRYRGQQLLEMPPNGGGRRMGAQSLRSAELPESPPPTSAATPPSAAPPTSARLTGTAWPSR